MFISGYGVEVRLRVLATALPSSTKVQIQIGNRRDDVPNLVFRRSQLTRRPAWWPAEPTALRA
jgi:hypothetical protein